MTRTVEARTRRELVRRAAVSAAAVAALSRPGAAAAQAGPPESDTQLLERTFRTNIWGYFFMTLATLERELSARCAQPAGPPRDVVTAQRGFAAHHMYTSLTKLPSQNACLKLLIDVETVAESAYLEAIAKLGDARLLRISAEIMGAEAQHWTALSSVRHHGDVMMSVPYPFVGGST